MASSNKAISLLFYARDSHSPIYFLCQSSDLVSDENTAERHLRQGLSEHGLLRSVYFVVKRFE